MSVALLSARQSSETCLEAVWSCWTSWTHCPASAAMWWFRDVLRWYYVGPTYATGGHGRLWNGYTIQEWHPPTYSQPYRQNFGEEFVLIDDNSRPHRAHLVNEFLNDDNIARLDWLTCSLDMNPIDHAWDTFKRAVFGRDDPPTSLRDLLRFAVEEWDNLDQRDFDELVDSMPRRIQASINARGTCYWVLEVLVFAAAWHTISKSLAVLLYNLQFLVFMSNTESWNVVFVFLYSICM